MKILLDNGMNPRLNRILGHAHELTHAYWLGWELLVNGDLLRAGEEAGFGLLITTDTKMYYQQNNASRIISILVLPSNNWDWLGPAHERIVLAVEASSPGSYLYLEREAESKHD